LILASRFISGSHLNLVIDLTLRGRDWKEINVYDIAPLHHGKIRDCKSGRETIVNTHLADAMFRRILMIAIFIFARASSIYRSCESQFAKLRIPIARGRNKFS